MSNRKSISKKIRFEVFKRDGFKCQYCGASAPDVILEVDHIDPVSKSGANEMFNYITSCSSCNSGKSDRTLDDNTVLAKQRAQLQDLNERREQLEMMLAWRTGLKGIDELQLEEVEKLWKEVVPGFSINDAGRKTLRGLIKKHGVAGVLDAVEASAEKYVEYGADGAVTRESAEACFKKISGVLALKSMSESQRSLHYVKGILRNRISYVPADIVRKLKEAFDKGVDPEAMKEQAKLVKNWTQFSQWLHATAEFQ